MKKRTVLPRHTGQSDRMRPSVEITATRQGMNLPLCCNARLTAFSMPPQQGTSMRTIVTERMELPRRISVSFSL